MRKYKLTACRIARFQERDAVAVPTNSIIPKLKHAVVILPAILFWLMLASISAQIPIIPKPQSLTVEQGAFTLSAASTIRAPKDRRSREIADFLRNAIREQTGIKLSTKGSPAPIDFVFDRTIAHAEGYRLRIEPSGITISARESAGFFWAVQTLRQMLPFKKVKSFQIPAIAIDDWPAFDYRGHMLDVGRHFFSVGFIKKQIDMLSLYKINTFRWHLTEDQGWRIEIKKYPKLTKVGAWRIEPDGTRYGGFYTQNQIREIVEYARLRNVAVVPEIEMPGHSTAALAAYPELACATKPVVVTNAWGVHHNVFCPRERTFKFLRDVLDEIIQMFPSPYIHIGGDEVPKDAWTACPECLMPGKSEGMASEHDPQRYFIRHIQDYLRSKGKTLIGWDEILEGGADRDSIIEIWRGDDEARKALENGNRIIIAGPFYFDASPQNRTLKNVYDVRLLSTQTHRDRPDLVLGAECPLWTEHVTESNAESLLYPRLQAFAEVTWTGANRDYNDFRTRLGAHYRIMDSFGIAYGPEDKAVVSYKLSYEPLKSSWRFDAKRGFPDLALHFTTDGREPSARSPSFEDSIRIDRPMTLKAAPFRSSRRYADSRAFRVIENKALGTKVHYMHPANHLYTGAGEISLVDGILGSSDFADGNWVGWQDADMDAVVDLKHSVSFRSININFMQQSASWIVIPRFVTIYSSDNGVEWKRLTEINTHSDALDLTPAIRTFTFASDTPSNARYIRVTAKQFGSLPAGHTGAGGSSFIFADEIVIK